MLISLFQNGFELQKFPCHPLSGDELFRNLIMVTRQNDLWNLPDRLTEDIHSMLEIEFLTYINRDLSWLKEKIMIA